MTLTPLEDEPPGTAVTAHQFDAEIERLELAAGASAVAIAVSGGPDSMALCRLAQHWAAHRDIRVFALTVDHRLRVEAAGEARQVASWLTPLGIQHEILAWQGGETIKHLDRSPQAAAREARFDLMVRWCQEHQVPYLMTAHHADDQAETFLMRLVRGSGVEGLGAMAAKSKRGSIEVLRPLLAVTKADLVATCEAFDQPWVQDPSNIDDAYTRTRIRKLMLALKGEGLSRDRLLKTVTHMQRAQAAIDFAVQDLTLRAKQETADGSLAFDAQVLLNAPDEVTLRCLTDSLKTVSGASYPPRFASLERVFKDLKASHWTDRTLHGCQLRLVESTLIVSKEAQNRKIHP